MRWSGSDDDYNAFLAGCAFAFSVVLVTLTLRVACGVIADALAADHISSSNCTQLPTLCAKALA